MYNQSIQSVVMLSYLNSSLFKSFRLLGNFSVCNKISTNVEPT